MKIWVQTATSYGYEPVWDGYGQTLLEQCRRVMRPGVEATVHGMPVMMRDIETYLCVEAPHQMQMFTNMLRAEREGYDAFAITCSEDPFLREGREMLAMPVIGITQTAFHYAALLGDQFAVIASSYILHERYRRMLVGYGLSGRCLPGPFLLNAREEEMARALADPGPGVDRFMAAARKAIDAGASMLVPLPAFIGTCLYKAGVTEIDGVVILDPVATLIKTAELLADLQAAGVQPSRREGHFARVPREMRDAAIEKYAAVLRLPD